MSASGADVLPSRWPLARIASIRERRRSAGFMRVLHLACQPSSLRRGRRARRRRQWRAHAHPGELCRQRQQLAGLQLRQPDRAVADDQEAGARIQVLHSIRAPALVNSRGSACCFAGKSLRPFRSPQPEGCGCAFRLRPRESCADALPARPSVDAAAQLADLLMNSIIQ
jgi:hypothetical protein